MIAAVALLAFVGAEADVPSSPFHISFLDGGTSVKFVRQDLWLDFGCQAEYDGYGFLRIVGSAAMSGANGGRGSAMFDSSQVPTSGGGMFTFCLGHEWRWGNKWLATGAGWAWADYDTVVVYDDPRELYVEDANGIHTTTVPIEGWIWPLESKEKAHWIWTDSMHGTSPYIMAEAGAGWKHFGAGVRAEYRFSPNIGLFLRLRLP